jgi:alkylation response protein AidB-like acyl-CoA dehydrogenase
VAPLPLLPSAVASITLARHGGAALKDRHLPQVASGEAILTWAFFETDARLRPETVKMTAREEDDGFILNGRKLFVDHYAAADLCLVVARTEAGLSLFLVDTDAPGISTRELVTLAKDRQSEVNFENVRVPREALVGQAGDAWPQIEEMLDLATILLCAQMVGATRKDAEMAFDYAKVRSAFGQPIGAFQSVQHMCADMQIWADAAELLTFEALWRLDQGLPAAMEISQAKSFCNDRLEAAVRNSQIIHGGIGFMMEFDLHLWFRRVSAWSMRMGTSLEHRARIAELLLDSPGQVRLGRSVSPAPAVPVTPELTEV